MHGDSDSENNTGTAAASLVAAGVPRCAARTRGAPDRGLDFAAIVLLAVPMVLEIMMESVFAAVDIFFVSRLGASARAAVALTESMLTTIYTLVMGLGIGVTALVAPRMGERDSEAGADAAAQAILLGGGLAILLGGALSWHAPRLLALMGAAPDVVELGSGFARVMLGGSGSVLLLFLINAALRGAADAAVAMRVLWIANAINIVLCPLLIYGIGLRSAPNVPCGWPAE